MPSGAPDIPYSVAVSTTGGTKGPPWLTPPVRPPEILANLPLLTEFELLNIQTRDPIGWFAYGSAITGNVRGTPTQDQGQSGLITS
jgi:hypothetical protein